MEPNLSERPENLGAILYLIYLDLKKINSALLQE